MGDKSPKNNTKAKKQKADKKSSQAVKETPVGVQVPVAVKPGKRAS